MSGFQTVDMSICHVLICRVMFCRVAKSGKASVKATVENPRGSVEKLSPKENVKGDHTAPQHSVGTRGILLRGQFFNTAPRIFNSCSDYQNHEVYLPANTFTGLVHTVVGSANRKVAQKFGIGCRLASFASKPHDFDSLSNC